MIEPHEFRTPEYDDGYASQADFERDDHDDDHDDAPPKRETNVEFFTRVMEFSRHGALMQMFIVDALTKHAEQVANIPDANLHEFDGGFVNPVAWRSVARELRDELDRHFDR